MCLNPTDMECRENREVYSTTDVLSDSLSVCLSITITVIFMLGLHIPNCFASTTQGVF